MANKAKAAGTDAETKTKLWARRHGYRYARRLTLAGAADEGDVTFGDGIPLCVEVKGGQKALSGISGHMRELAAEKLNVGAEIGIVVSKKPRSADPDEWVISMTGADFMKLFKQVHPPPPSYDDGHGTDDMGDDRVRPRRRIRIRQRVDPDVG